jgi:hypothetical protein
MVLKIFLKRWELKLNNYQNLKSGLQEERFLNCIVAIGRRYYTEVSYRYETKKQN